MNRVILICNKLKYTDSKNTLLLQVRFDGSVRFSLSNELRITPLGIALQPFSNIKNVRTTLWVGYSNDSDLLSRAQCDITAQFTSQCGSNFNPKHLLKVTTLNYTEGMQV